MKPITCASEHNPRSDEGISEIPKLRLKIKVTDFLIYGRDASVTTGHVLFGDNICPIFTIYTSGLFLVLLATRYM